MLNIAINLTLNFYIKRYFCKKNKWRILFFLFMFSYFLCLVQIEETTRKNKTKVN